MRSYGVKGPPQPLIMFMLLMSVALSFSVLCSATSTISATPKEELFVEGEALLSADELWASKGFRLGLHALYGAHQGLKGAPNASLSGVEFGLGARLDARWLLMSRLQYALASGGVEGVHMSATLEPSLALTSWLSAGVSLGVAGLLELSPARPDALAERSSSIVATYDHPQADPLLAQCVGFGPSQGARLNTRFVMGELSAFTLGVYVSTQRVWCVQESERVEPDSAEPIERRQRWSHQSWGLTGGFTWR